MPFGSCGLFASGHKNERRHSMKDTENVFDGFALLGDDEEFDVDKIFGNSSD